MSDSVLDDTPAPVARGAGPLTRLARHVVFKTLENLRHGHIELHDGDLVRRFGVADAPGEYRARISVHHPGFYRALAFGGTLGAAEAYMDAWWGCDDLVAAVRIMVRNLDVLQEMESGLARLFNPLRKTYHWLRRNTPEGGRRNIAAHYDLGNEFFALFLDESMTYSCGIFDRPEATMHEASVSKLDRICRKLALSPQDHILEIGTGWGSFALQAAVCYGCRVTTTTISKEQHELACERVRRAGLQGRVEVLLKDYRDLQGRYDKLVSIEMIEAVGHQYYNTFFRKCSDLLKPDGMMLLQAITVADQAYEQSKREVDFIKRYIFPGSTIPSVHALCASVAEATDMAVFHMEALTPHYATTLRRWRERFFENIDQIRQLGYSETFIRMWEYYLCYCEGGFMERYIGAVQMLLCKPLCRRAPILPAIREEGGR